MMSKRKPFILLPFLGSSEEPERRKGFGHTHKPRENGDANGSGTAVRGGPEFSDLTQQETAKMVAQKTEEDIVQDYNAPIHMWVCRTKKCKLADAALMVYARWLLHCSRW